MFTGKRQKQMKLVALAIAVLFVVGVGGLAVSQTGVANAAPNAGESSNIGYVNYQMLLMQHPDTQAAQQAMQTEIDNAKKDFDEKSTGMSDQEKQQYYLQLQQRLNLKNQELFKPIYDKVDAAIKDVANVQGITVVLDKSNVIYGGKDLTDAVLKKIVGK